MIGGAVIAAAYLKVIKPKLDALQKEINILERERQAREYFQSLEEEGKQLLKDLYEKQISKKVKRTAFQFNSIHDNKDTVKQMEIKSVPKLPEPSRELKKFKFNSIYNPINIKHFNEETNYE